VTLRGPDLGLEVAVDSPLARCVGWQYADPSGDIHHVRNCSNAAMRVQIMGDNGTTLTTTDGAVYELGTPEAEADLVIQPFPDR
jgi:hypothetical protein